jgi:serine/threonine-protein kinase
LRKLNNEISAHLETLVLQTLRKEPGDRYQTASELFTDLQEIKKQFETFTARERMARADDETEPRKAQTGNSIAVLPFANVSPDAENEFFCDGLTEELLNALAKIQDLKVAARTSAFFFKGKNANVSEIGNTLGVNTVLEGSVRKAGNQVRITVQLVKVSDGYHLWSERYDRDMQDIFDLQDEITLAVVDALKVKLLGEEKAAVLKRYTDKAEAYELFLKGLYYSKKDTAEGWLRSIEYFEKAIAEESEYAPAYAAMSECYSALHIFGVLPPPRTVPKWKAAVRRALEIDDQLAEAHLAKANLLFWYEWNWTEAEEEFTRALKLNPNGIFAHQMYALFLTSRERFDEAIGIGKRALELDILSLLAKLRVGWVYLLADREADAREQIQKMIEIEPNFHGAFWLLGAMYLAKGEMEEAIGAFQKSLDLGGTPITLSNLGCAYGLAGKRNEALRVLDQLLDMRRLQYADASNIARVYAGLGDTDKAFEWLEKAVDERTGIELVFLDRLNKMGHGESWGKGFRDDPRYPALLRRIGLPTDDRAPSKSVEKASEAPTIPL